MEATKKTDGQKRAEYQRTKLKGLSVKARDLREVMIKRATAAGNLNEVERWSMARVNDIIAGWYKEDTGATELRSFRQWALAGYYVERGSRAFTLWGKKRSATLQVAAGELEEREYDFFPIAYLFSDKQVKPKTTVIHEDTSEAQEHATANSSMATATAATAAANSTAAATATATANSTAAAIGKPSSFEKAFTAEALLAAAD
jgi:hypothetical protein